MIREKTEPLNRTSPKIDAFFIWLLNELHFGRWRSLFLMLMMFFGSWNDEAINFLNVPPRMRSITWLEDAFYQSMQTLFNLISTQVLSLPLFYWLFKCVCPYWWCDWGQYMSQEKGEKKQEHCAYTMRIICKMLSESIIVEIKKKPKTTTKLPTTTTHLLWMLMLRNLSYDSWYMKIVCMKIYRFEIDDYYDHLIAI